MRILLTAVAAALGLMLLANTAPAGASSGVGALNLSTPLWKLTLPTGSDTKADETTDLTHLALPWFQLDQARGAVLFRARADGARTSANTKYPRSELREMVGQGQRAAWDTNSGTHTLTARLAVTAVTPARSSAAPRMSLLQIHESQEYPNSSDILQILYDNSTDRNEADITYRVYGKTQTTGGADAHGSLISNYVLGTPFTAEIVVAANQVAISINGVQMAQFPVDPTRASAYFKAGAYLQFSVNDVNKTKGVAGSDYGEMALSGLSVDHRGANMAPAGVPAVSQAPPAARIPAATPTPAPVVPEPPAAPALVVPDPETLPTLVVPEPEAASALVVPDPAAASAPAIAETAAAPAPVVPETPTPLLLPLGAALSIAAGAVRSRRRHEQA